MTLQQIEELLSSHGGYLRLRMTDRLRGVLEERRVYLGWEERPPAHLREILVGRFARIEATASFHAGNALCSMGFMSYTHSLLPPTITIGRYCSIAHNVRVMGEAHPLDRFTTSRFTYAGLRPAMAAMKVLVGDYLEGRYFEVPKQPVKPRKILALGHDVWIGQDTLLANHVTLGTGCVIGAGSVVTKDVPPYAIFGGCPARLIRMRFPDEITARLLESKWWNYHPSLLLECGSDMQNVETFLDNIDAARASAEEFHPEVTAWNTIEQLLA